MLAVTLLVLFVVSSVSAHPGTPHVVLGKVTNKDVIVYKINEYKYAVPLFYRSSIVEFPPPGHGLNDATIDAIDIEDNLQGGVQGKAILLSGGIGQKHLKIKLESQWCSGFNMTVTIFGRL